MSVMKNFDELLYKLIRGNRRVIIPDIGAFITGSEDNNTVFSPLLKHNDGFLEDRLRREGIADPAMFIRELAENIISVVERGQHFRIAGLGYFFKDGSIRFVFDTGAKNNVGERSVDNRSPKKTRTKNKVWLVAGLILLGLTVTTGLLLIVSGRVSKKPADMFTMKIEKHNNQLTIIDKSDESGEIGDVQTLPMARNHHVIVACFEERDGAEQFVMQCRTNGYEKTEILCITDMLYLVSVGVFTSSNDAMNAKREYDRRFNENSIILKTK
jgi:hypothetical protein